MKTFILLLLLLITSCQTHHVPFAEKERTDLETIEATGENFAIATQGKYATLAAQEMYAQKGNIIDATVAASFVVSVERPQSTGIGGGGFMIYRDPQGNNYAIDFRERAPLKASRNMFVKKGKVTQASLNGVLAVGTPGLVAGLLEVHHKFGSLPLKIVMEPAIRLANEGFPIYPNLYTALENRKNILAQDSAAKKIFLNPQGEAWPIGHILIQKDLAQTLSQISERGSDVFYKGSLAQQITTYMKKQNGLISNQDLKSYRVKWREPLLATYKNFEVVSMPPPSSGGIHVLQFLKFLEQDHLKKYGPLSTTAIHLAASALQSAFADRARYLGDPDFVSVPTSQLLSSTYLQTRRAEVSLVKARKAEDIQAGQIAKEHTETTHISILDKSGSAVSTTQTLNGWMGAAVVVPGTGIVLNNEMDDFSAQTGASNLFGAIGGEANAIEPLKTPLSSMSPTLLIQNNRPVLSLGAPGGTRIISCVAQTILNYTEFQLPLRESVSMVRYHHQWKPDVLTLDPPGPSLQVQQDLKSMGYLLELKPVPCNVMAVSREGSRLKAVADPRDIGTAAAQ